MVEHLLVDLVSGFLPPFVGVLWIDSRDLLFGGQGGWRIGAEGLGMQVRNAFGGLGSFELELHDNFLNSIPYNRSSKYSNAINQLSQMG